MTHISLSVCSAHWKMSEFSASEFTKQGNVISPPPPPPGPAVWPLTLLIMFKILSRFHRFSTWYRCVIIWVYNLRPNISYLVHTSNSAVFPISPPQTYIRTFCQYHRIKKRILLDYLGLFVLLLANCSSKIKKKKAYSLRFKGSPKIFRMLVL